MRRDSLCPVCGRSEIWCICDPREEGRFFASYAEKREYSRTHPDSKGAIRLTPCTPEEQLFEALKQAHRDKSDEELQAMVERVMKANTGG